jgi:hypothetical protein
LPSRQEVQVGVIVIRCPNTGREVSTGLESDARTYQRIPVFFSRTYCPTCRTNHEWFARDAWVRDDLGGRTGQQRAGGAAPRPVSVHGQAEVV